MNAFHPLLVLGGVWVLIFLAGLVFLPQFRKTYIDWITFKDPLGGNFHRKNTWFTILTVIFLAVASIIISKGYGT